MSEIEAIIVERFRSDYIEGEDYVRYYVYYPIKPTPILFADTRELNTAKLICKDWSYLYLPERRMM